MLNRIQLACVIVLFTLGKIECSGLPVGKCNTENIVPFPLPVKEVEKHLKWKVLYATQLADYIDYESYVFTILGGKNYKLQFKAVLFDDCAEIWDSPGTVIACKAMHKEACLPIKITKKDKTVSTYHALMKNIDHVLIEAEMGADGKLHHYYMYPLLLTKSLGVLVYRCSDVGNDPIDYRLIAFPRETIPSKSEVQELLDFDKATFPHGRGNLTLLPSTNMDD